MSDEMFGLTIGVILVIITVTVSITILKLDAPKDVEMWRVYEIESSNDRDAISPSDAHGLGQIMRDTWNDAVADMGVDWDFDADWNNEYKNKMVATHYMNTMIPKMLKHFKIKDCIESRLAAYNWGIGNFNVHYHYSGNWKATLPADVKDYIRRYKECK